MTMTAYTLTRESLNTISDVEMAFGTTKLLPPYEMIPEEFKEGSGGNAYTKLMDCMAAQRPIPEGEVIFRAGFEDAAAPQQLMRVIHAHLKSFQPKHEHKISGLGYLVSLVCELKAA